jgi:dimethylaniline monooxygenase (N-oxide forming)
MVNLFTSIGLQHPHSGKSVHLSSGQTLPCDAVVFATGWKRTQPPIFDSALLPELGLVPGERQSADFEKHWSTLDSASDAETRALFPMLASPPADVIEYFRKNERPTSNTPFRLFRNIVPPIYAAKGDRSLIKVCVEIGARLNLTWGCC